MYITSGLFDGSDRSTRCHSPTSTHPHTWNTMTESQLAASLGKRKRRTDDDEEVVGSNYSFQPRLSPSSRGLLKLQGHNPAFDTNHNKLYPISTATTTYSSPERRPVKQMRRFNSKIALIKSPSHLMDVEPDLPPNTNTDSHSHSDLRPCHACKTAPKRKRDLENYMECKRCDGRTCYICARECLGGCGKAICKKCIVEVGREGDPWCLDCYQRNINS